MYDHGPKRRPATRIIGTACALLFAAVLAAPGPAACRDMGINDAVSKALDKATSLEGIIDVADWYGDGITLGAATAGLLVLGGTTGNGEIRSLSVDLTESLVMSTGVVWALKISVDAKRPNGGNYSFPSGHTASAFAVAPVLHRRYGRAVGFAAYAIACFTGLGRVEDRRHYLADVLAGAAIGVACGREVSRGAGISGFLKRFRIGRSGLYYRYDF